ncbi:MAG TPA: hypothetical protein ENK29_05615 [Chromatiales bacterium]|nr:hypothetical protein [Chromatiales bacterium]
MARNRKRSASNIHESFSDVALLMLATFIFLLVVILISSRLAEESEVPRLQEEVRKLREQLNMSEADKERLLQNLERVVVTDPETQLEKILEAASVGRKDFDLFVEGLKDIPGRDIHLIVDATGSMHGVSIFLVPILRLIVIRADKELNAITWFSDNRAITSTGTMAEMFDNLMSEAPFAGNRETIGRAFRVASQEAPVPGAYMLIGDEPSDDVIHYTSIPSPVFTLPMGRLDPATEEEYRTLAAKTGGKMLNLIFK